MDRLRPGLAGITATLVLANAPAALAHEIPARVAVLAFIKPEGERLRLVMRVPIEAIRDVDFPLRAGRPGSLDIASAESLLRDAAALWLAGYVTMYENDAMLDNGRVVSVRVSLPSDRAFESYGSAVSRVLGPPLPPETEVGWQQAMLDVLIEYPIQSAASAFSIRPALAHLGQRTSTVLRYLPAGGHERALHYVGDPGLIRLDPRWHQAAAQFVKLGFSHILGGLDHLLFVICLVIPFRRVRPLVVIVTSFTVAHSITLGASALGWVPDALWFPPLIEVLIALSILYMAVENIVRPAGSAGLRHRWLIAFGFGLVHGFGFSFALRESLQFAGSHLATSLMAFNVGVELGQLFVLAVALPLLAATFKYVVAERLGTIVLSAIVAHTAWHWMLDRGAALREYSFQWPALDLALAASAMRGLIVVLILGAVAWALAELFKRLRLSESPRAGVENP